MQTRIYSGLTHLYIRPLFLNLQSVRVSVGSSSNPNFFLLHLDFGFNGHLTSPSSYTHLKSFKLQSRASLFYTWISSSIWHLTILSSYTHLKLSLWSTMRHSLTLKMDQIQLKLLMNTKVHSIICTCNECT